ncbi:MAG: hypothetical protein JW795_00495, partial [Chitinivibrionales bacterium]|nr:hypothetical protein [Chitinivibrionales bacterium]
ATPLLPSEAGAYHQVLEMVRLAPSAANKQPWRVIKQEHLFHFCLDHSKMYRLIFKHFDIQRLDIGIALCHFELTAREKSLNGGWCFHPEVQKTLPENVSYVTTWECR